MHPAVDAGQVQESLESRRRSTMWWRWPAHSFRDVELIDLSRSRTASAEMERPGFERLVAALCAGAVGAVLCVDASRLARNGRDWHHLLELCGLVEARVIDRDGIYDPCILNDQLLLGMKGTISEFKTGILRARLVGAVRAKAARGELRISVPIGFIWDRDSGVRLDPDLRVQEMIRLVFRRLSRLLERSSASADTSIE